jgi:hypothetical protein
MAADGRTRRVGVLLLVLILAVTGHAFAQIDLAGQWRALLHEDIGHRLDEAAAAPGISGAGGQWIGDYAGLPINDAARFKAESWDPRIYTAKEHQTILQPGQHRAFVPHHLPGTNTALKEFADKFGLPVDATRGGPETAYPEFHQRRR